MNGLATHWTHPTHYWTQLLCDCGSLSQNIAGMTSPYIYPLDSNSDYRTYEF